MDDVARDLARARLAGEMQAAHKIRDLAWAALKNGTRPEYLAMRYNIPLEALLRGKAELERRAAEKANVSTTPPP